MKSAALPSHKGFTLIELLIVVAIIGILSTAILANLGQSRARARDAVRKHDLHTIQTALEMYYNTCGSYVVKLNCAGTAYGSGGIGWFNGNYGSGSVGKGLVDNGLMGKEIVDPSRVTAGPTAYMINGGASRYTIWATIEDPSAEDTATLATCYFSGYDNYSGAGTQNYCVSN